MIAAWAHTRLRRVTFSVALHFALVWVTADQCFTGSPSKGWFVAVRGHLGVARPP
ncbi:hypothetical protein [Mycobacterium sp. DL99]|uniref:hypothetical protein n=1 Tax=Mycobacterium sp. DL99 TaxID=2528957 RepID=UPI001436A1DB|nr:hypothetical protein [Mycobacterium sp. DL99]